MTQSRASSYVHDSEDYQAPEINIIEDKTHFSVAKHIRGIKQDGFDFGSTAVKSNSKSDKSISNNKASETTGNKEKKAQMSEDEYIQLLLNKSVLDKSSKESNRNSDKNASKSRDTQEKEKPQTHRKINLK